MKAIIIKDCNVIDYGKSWIKLKHGQEVEVKGTPTEDGSICILVDGIHCMIKVENLEAIE